ncbi:MAG: CerR family C-terminal domain-containing protein [Alphaproteobacteria bacterium]|nr:CerR family C-terminal domain-containing protein [Alphaproteobacteria bacterium]
MTSKSRSVKRKVDRRVDRGEATRQKLLIASIREFGRLGFEGVSTRALAQAAGVNLQAIPYYFRDKEGLYLAAAEHITGLVKAHVGELADRIRGRLDDADQGGREIKKAEARALLTEIARTMAALFVSPQSDVWAQFVVHEQSAPTAAFSILYRGFMGPMLQIAERLLAILLEEPVGSEHIRLRLVSLLGSILVFRVARGTILSQLGWSEIGPGQANAVLDMVPELLATIDRR